MNEQTNQSSTHAALPASLDQQLRGFRTRLRTLKLAETLLSAIAGLLAGYLLVFVVERFVAIPAILRAVILIVFTLGFSLGIPIALRKWFWNTRRLEQVARFLRGTFPVLGDEILGVIEMVDRRSAAGASERLIAAATEQTSGRVAGTDLDQAASASPVKKRGLIAAAAVAVAGLLLAFVPSAAWNSWLRFANPLTKAERFTFAQLDQLPNQLPVPYGESFSFDAALNSTSQWKPTTALASIGPHRVNAEIQNDAYKFSVPAQTSPGRMKVSVGDDRSSVRVNPITRPELVAITSKITLPTYLQYPAPVERTSTNRRFDAISGSQIEFTIEANREIDSATLNGEEVQVANEFVSTAPLDVAQSHRKHVLNWLDIHGLGPRKPIELHVNAVKDQAPSIVFERLKDTVLLESKSLRFNFNGRDDFGIKKIGLQWTGTSVEGNSQPIEGEKILLAGEPQQKTAANIGILTPSIENIQPQILTLRLFVEDYLPGRERVYSRPQTLQLMSHDDHVAWINRKMDQWRASADAIYEREVALADENRELRNLDDQASQLPENIRRLQTQAAAERENARRLEQAVDRGTELIRQAMANENMRAEQVEQWANSLAQLEQIAENRMPQIADRLSDINQNMRNRSDNDAEESPPAAGSRPGQGGGDQSTPTDSSGGGSQQQPRSANTGDPENEDNAQQGLGGVGQNRATPMNQPTAEDEDSEDQEEQQQQPAGASAPVDTEQSMLDKKEVDPEPAPDDNAGDEGNADDAQEDEEPQGGLALPGTMLVNPDIEPGQDNGEEQLEQPQQPQEPEEPSLDDVVEDQEKLLEEFRNARGAMNEVMGEFENSTFVKRFKAAARQQLDVASRLNTMVPTSFGSQDSDAATDPERIADTSERQRAIFDFLRALKIDLEAYQTREAEEARQAILDDMEVLEMQVKLEELPLRIERNRLGDALHRTEFWADTFDRWGEELVPPIRGTRDDGGQDDQQQQQQDQGRGLPASIVLDIMRQIEAEMSVRDETRNLELARAAIEPNELQQRNDGLTVYQMSVLERTLDTMGDIREMRDGEAEFNGELRQLEAAINSMNEASGMLFDGTTGDFTLAAESAAIEGLLQTGRTDPPPPPPPSADTSQQLGSGLAFLDRLRADEGNSWEEQERDPGTSSHGHYDQVPERFRNGVDSFTERLNRLKRSQ